MKITKLAAPECKGGENPMWERQHPLLHSPCWSPDEKTFYFSDSWIDTTFAYDYDIETGAVCNRRPFVNTRGLGGLARARTASMATQSRTARALSSWSMALAPRDASNTGSPADAIHHAKDTI